MPILGVIASSKLVAPAGDYESIQTVTTTAGQGSISLTSIPSTYKHLQVRMSNIRYQGDQLIKITYNSNGSSIYGQHEMTGSGSGSVGSSGGGSNTRWDTMYVVNNAQSANIGMAAILDIFDYSAGKNTSSRLMYGVDFNGSGKVGIQDCAFLSTTAISTITFAPFSTNFIVGCKFALYGIKG
jgi:hypothetical protein